MKGAEKRMKYYNLSKNIIACENFLPKNKVEEIYTNFLNSRTQFNIPNWAKKIVQMNIKKVQNFLVLHVEVWSGGERGKKQKNSEPAG